MTRYAAETTVSEERSRNEIEKTLRRYGAAAFGYVVQDNTAAIEFMLAKRRIRFVIHMPLLQDVSLSPKGRRRSVAAARQALAQAHRQRWRALALFVKAALEAIENGVITLDEAFLAQFVLPGGRTVLEHALPAIDQAYNTGKVSGLLPDFTR